MVDLVKIRKKAKESSDAAKPKPNAPDAAVATAAEPVPAVAEKRVKKSNADRRPTNDEKAGSEQRAASRGEKPATPPAPEPRRAEEPPPAPATAEPTKTTEPASKAVSKLDRYKEQAGKRREKAEARGKTTAAATTAEDEQLELLTFAIAGESYAIEIDNIVEIVPPRAATKVPNATAAIVGIISLRGTIVTLIDVRRRLKQRAVEPTAETRIIVLEHDGETVGFEVDRVFRVAKIAASEVEPHPVVHASEQDESIRGVFRHGESLTILLDFAKLLGGREVARTGPRQAVTASRR